MNTNIQDYTYITAWTVVTETLLSAARFKRAFLLPPILPLKGFTYSSFACFFPLLSTLSTHKCMNLELQRPALRESQGSVKNFLGSSTGWWADSTATLLPGKKEIGRGTSK